MNQQKDIIRDARVLGTPKMLLLGLQHMFAMFGATILVPILVNSYFQSTSQVLSVQVTLFCAGFGTLFFHLCTKFKVPAFLGSSFAFLGGFSPDIENNDERQCHNCKEPVCGCIADRRRCKAQSDTDNDRAGYHRWKKTHHTFYANAPDDQCKDQIQQSCHDNSATRILQFFHL